MEYRKVKSAAKEVMPRGEALSSVVLDTLGKVSRLVGATLGPGGRPVLIERYEHNLPPTITKDGVTCFRALGFSSPTQHVIMEAARDASVRTASEAGDGTTTATVLAHAFVERMHHFCAVNGRVSPQKVVRRLEQLFREVIGPSIEKCSIRADFSEEGTKLLWSVAKVSANGDGDLADAVMKCFGICGDEGNVTLVEIPGPSSYEVEQIDGYPVPVGYEQSCGAMYSKFVNDPATQRCVLEKPVFALFHGRITEIQTVQKLMERIGFAWGNGLYDHHNVVLVATGFSESVLAQLALNFSEATTINVFPLTAPQSPTSGGQLAFLQDLAAVTGSTIMDSISNPPDAAELQDLGPGVETFEATRYRSNLVGHAQGAYVVGYDGKQPVLGDSGDGTYDYDLFERIDQLKALARNPESQLDKMLLDERIAKLSGGIARLKIVGASNGETKEKRDRAEDAVCAVRGALKRGCLPGGGWMLLRVSCELLAAFPNDPIVTGVVVPALQEPVVRLLENAGLNAGEVNTTIGSMLMGCLVAPEKASVYDASQHAFVQAVADGLLDSTPAVFEAVRNSISIAALLGALGGTIVFGRDVVLERTEASDTADFMRNANVNEADERA